VARAWICESCRYWRLYERYTSYLSAIEDNRSHGPCIMRMEYTDAEFSCFRYSHTDPDTTSVRTALRSPIPTAPSSLTSSRHARER